MKKIIYYIGLMVIVIIILPFLIVKSCSFSSDEVPSLKQDRIMICIYMHKEKIIKEMEMEEYIKGVVAAEMPVSFELEALKAQAVAARTYAIGRIGKIYVPKDDSHQGADICTDPSHCQAWISKEDASKNWGIFWAFRCWNKICRSVHETNNIIIFYNNSIINPVFHSNSGGRTENAEDVWDGCRVPYLTSVKSEGEEACLAYKNSVSVKTVDFNERLKKEYPDLKIDGKNILNDIKILDYTEGGRVKTLRVGNIDIKGTDFRKLFNLKSANFKIEKDGANNLLITTIGNGHGAGMSQWGANYLAKGGGNYEEILKYYYNGITLGINKK